jgi:hypothetical protein
MNIKIENEKKVYVAPFMEIVSMESETKLLSDSSNDRGIDLDLTDKEYEYGELN